MRRNFGPHTIRDVRFRSVRLELTLNVSTATYMHATAKGGVEMSVIGAIIASRMRLT